MSASILFIIGGPALRWRVFADHGHGYVSVDFDRLLAMHGWLDFARRDRAARWDAAALLPRL